VTFDNAEAFYGSSPECRRTLEVTLVDTGDQTGTGGTAEKNSSLYRGRRPLLHDLRRWRERHRYLSEHRFSTSSTGGRVTIAAVQPLARFRRHWGWMDTAIHFVSGKATGGRRMDQWGFLCVVPKVLDEIHNDAWLF